VKADHPSIGRQFAHPELYAASLRDLVLVHPVGLPLVVDGAGLPSEHVAHEHFRVFKESLAKRELVQRGPVRGLAVVHRYFHLAKDTESLAFGEVNRG
jgi:hypothetical protein